jgi:hypothetical protein
MGCSPSDTLKHGRLIVIGVVLDWVSDKPTRAPLYGAPASSPGAAFHSSITRTSGWLGSKPRMLSDAVPSEKCRDCFSLLLIPSPRLERGRIEPISEALVGKASDERPAGQCGRTFVPSGIDHMRETRIL